MIFDYAYIERLRLRLASNFKPEYEIKQRGITVEEIVAYQVGTFSLRMSRGQHTHICQINNREIGRECESTSPTVQ